MKTREQYMQQMRMELERDLTPEDRTAPVVVHGTRQLSSNDLMDEVEKQTELGKALLADFIAFQTGKSPAQDAGHFTQVPDLADILKPVPRTLTSDQITKGVAMMESDIKEGGTLWANTPIFSEDGTNWSPTLILEQVKQGTEFGLRYLDVYLTNHEMITKLLGEGWDQLDSTNEQSN